jgi:hypothetical protein
MDKDMAETLEFLKILINIAEGREDPKHHITTITNPALEYLLSSGFLTAQQVDAAAVCFWAGENADEYQPLKQYAATKILAALSTKGWATDKGIALAGAYAPKTVVTPISNTPQLEQQKTHWYNRKKKSDVV